MFSRIIIVKSTLSTLLLLDFHRSLKIITVDVAKYRMMAFIEMNLTECLVKRIAFPSIFSLKPSKRTPLPLILLLFSRTFVIHIVKRWDSNYSFQNRTKNTANLRIFKKINIARIRFAEDTHFIMEESKDETNFVPSCKNKRSYGIN